MHPAHGLQLSSIGIRKLALVLVDIQNDFITGSLAVPNAIEIIPLINQIRKDSIWDAGVFLTQDWHPKDHKSFSSNNDNAPLFSIVEIAGMGEQVMWPDHCVQGSRGAEFYPELIRCDGDIVIQKGTNRNCDSYSGFGDASLEKSAEKTDLEKFLRAAGATDVYVCGLATDFCVSFTAKDAARLGFQTHCILSASRGITSEGCAAETAAMKALGVRLIDQWSPSALK